MPLMLFSVVNYKKSVSDPKEAIPRTYSIDLAVTPQVGWDIVHGNGELWKVTAVGLNLSTKALVISCSVV